MSYSSISGPHSNSRKRKATDLPPLNAIEVIDLTGDTPPKKRKINETVPENISPKTSKTKDAPEERRLARWRTHRSLKYSEIRSRALTQRMIILERKRDFSNPDNFKEVVTLAGTTGNVYTIKIDKTPSCDCPHARKGNQCKHIVYVLSRVLRVSEPLEYQLAFLSTELHEIFDKAPPLPSEQASNSEKDGNRKPLDGDCPICCVDFADSNDEVVFCKKSCGNNVHKSCFQQWAATKRGKDVPCPFCRAPWDGDDDELSRLARTGMVNDEGYVNVAQQLGMSGERDLSTYHQRWVRRQFGYNY